MNLFKAPCRGLFLLVLAEVKNSHHNSDDCSKEAKHKPERPQRLHDVDEKIKRLIKQGRQEIGQHR